MKDVEPLQPKAFHKGENHSRKLYLEIFKCSPSLALPYPFFFFYSCEALIFRVVRWNMLHVLLYCLLLSLSKVLGEIITF